MCMYTIRLYLRDTDNSIVLTVLFLIPRQDLVLVSAVGGASHVIIITVTKHLRRGDATTWHMNTTTAWLQYTRLLFVKSANYCDML